MAARNARGVPQPVLGEAVLPAHMSHLLTERDDAIKKVQLEKKKKLAAAQRKQKADAKTVAVHHLAVKGSGAKDHKKYHTHTGALTHEHTFAKD